VTAETSLLLASGIVSVGVLIDGLERVVSRDALSSSGLLSWRVLRYSRAVTIDGFWGAKATLFLDTPGVAYLAIAEVIAGMSGVLLAIGGVFHTLPIAAATVVLVAFNFRNVYGGDASDNMRLLVLGGLLAYGLNPDSASHLAVWFIAFHACLAYVASGCFKLASPAWRSGRAVVGVMATAEFGVPAVARALIRRRVIAICAAWIVILFEVLFPLQFALGYDAAFVFLSAGVVFHGFNAAVMGLNSFFWSFIATYPCIAWAVGELGGA
jgi:hypothetical protein